MSGHARLLIAPAVAFPNSNEETRVKPAPRRKPFPTVIPLPRPVRLGRKQGCVVVGVMSDAPKAVLAEWLTPDE